MARYYLAFWNVENLFAEVDWPDRSDKLQRVIGSELAGWTRDVLALKIERLAAIVVQMNGGAGPDILGVCEVENRHVLELLCAALAPLGRRYDVSHADAERDRRGIDVAFLYDRDLFEAHETFSHWILTRTGTRDLFQANMTIRRSGRDLVLIGNHWPARLGGQRESEHYRLIAGETLAYWHGRILEEKGREVAIVTMGDFNDEPFDRSVRECALAIRSGTRVQLGRNAYFLNLMWELLGERVGTHYWNNMPSILDQVMVSPGLVRSTSKVRVEPGSVRIETFPDMTSGGRYPQPIRFGRPTSNGRPVVGFSGEGYSDHYPISLVLIDA